MGAEEGGWGEKVEHNIDWCHCGLHFNFDHDVVENQSLLFIRNQQIEEVRAKKKKKVAPFFGHPMLQYILIDFILISP
jgi:hypothetical protein